MTAHEAEALYNLLRRLDERITALEAGQGTLEAVRRELEDINRRVRALVTYLRGDADADGRADSSIIVDTSER